MKATDFVVSADFRMFRVSWQDDINSYHVNLTNDRVVKGRGWGNNAERPALYRHNKVTGDIAVLDFQAKKYSVLRDSINSIPDVIFSKALAEYNRKEDARRAIVAAKVDEENMQKLRELADRYGYQLVKI